MLVGLEVHEEQVVTIVTLLITPVPSAREPPDSCIKYRNVLSFASGFLEVHDYL